MAINAQIPLGIQQLQLPQQDPNAGMNALARAMQIRGLQQEHEVNALKADEYRRTIAETNALNEAYKGALGADGVVDRNRLYSTLAERNLGARIPDIQKKFLDTDKAKFDTQKAAFEGYKNFQTTLGSHFNNPNVTKQDVIGSVAGLVQSGSFDGATAQKLVASLPDDPQQLRMALRQIITSQMTPEQMLTVFAPKPTEVDNGQQKFFRDTNPNSPTYGQVTGGAAVQKLETPDAVLSARTSEANNRRSVNAQLENAKATRDAAKTQADATRDAAAIKDRRDAEMKLADDYRTESKGWAETSTAMKKVMAAIETADKNPGSALSAGTGFMKLLDPNSVVRETELGLALNASGWFDRALNVANTLQHGRIMTAEQQKNLRSAAQTLFEEAKVAQREVDASYERRARDYKLDPKRVIVDRGQNAPRDARNGPREVSGRVTEGPSLFDQADAILRGGK